MSGEVVRLGGDSCRLRQGERLLRLVVGLRRLGHRLDVEEDGGDLVTCTGLGEGREPVAGDAEVVERDDAVVTVVLARSCTGSVSAT